MHCVWLAKGGRKFLKTMRLQLVIHSIMHGTNLTLTELDIVSVFQLRFPFPSLVKQFLHFTRAPLALVHPNVIRILTGCCVLNLLYQVDLSLVEVCFAYTLRVAQGGRMSMLAQSPWLQFVIGLLDSPKSEAKGVILVRGPWVPPTFRLMLTIRCLFQVCIRNMAYLLMY